jgi:hypothetical protein
VCEVREAGGGRRPRRTQRAGKSQTDYAVRVRSESTGRGAHVEHELHTLDAGGIPEVQRLIERRRALPRVEKGAYCGMRLVVRAVHAGGGRRETIVVHAGCRIQGPTVQVWVRAWAERTMNMPNMSLTLEVSQFGCGSC